MTDPVADDEALFRFLNSNNWVDDPVLGKRISSGLFCSRAKPVSVNRSAVWDEARHHEVCPADHGCCSVVAGEARAAVTVLDFEPDPLGFDPLLGIPNPSHCNFSRILNKTQGRALAALAQNRVHRVPPPAAPRN